MSRFLAPIHTWLFNKIRINEGMEDYLLQRLPDGDKVKRESEERFGVRTSEAPLEDQIDTGNIHGWLQEKITSSERRLSFIVKTMMDAVTTDEELKALFLSYGKEYSENYRTENSEELFKLIGDTVLEGMPCDMVLRILDSEDDCLTFQSAKDVHSENAAAAGLDPQVFRNLRDKFLRGLMEGQGYTTEILGEDVRTYRIQKI